MHFDEFRGVDRLRACLRNNRGDRFADETDDVACEHRASEVLGDPLVRRRLVGQVDVGGRHDRHDTGHRRRGRVVDVDARVRGDGADVGDMQRAGDVDAFDVVAARGEKARVFAAQDPRAEDAHASTLRLERTSPSIPVLPVVSLAWVDSALRSPSVASLSSHSSTTSGLGKPLASHSK